MKEDKIEQLLEVIEHPEAYSDEALDKLFEDEEVRECYELYVTSEHAARSRKNIPTLGTNNSHLGNKTFPRWEYLTAAVVMSVIVLSGIAYATISSKRNNIQETEKAANVTSQTISDTQPSATILPKDTTLTFQNTELNMILETIATHYQMGVEYRNEHIRHIRLYTKWNTAEPLEQIVERLNGFEKVNITIDHNLLIAE